MGAAVQYPQTYAATPPQAALGPPETEVPLLKAILYVLQSGMAGGGGSGFIVVNGLVVSYDSLVFTYYDPAGGSTNIQDITYKTGGTGGSTVAVQRFAYIQNAVTYANASVQAIATTAT